MAKREIEGDWVMGWPDRKRAELNAGKDAEAASSRGARRSSIRKA